MVGLVVQYLVYGTASEQIAFSRPSPEILQVRVASGRVSASPDGRIFVSHRWIDMYSYDCEKIREAYKYSGKIAFDTNGEAFVANPALESIVVFDSEFAHETPMENAIRAHLHRC